MKSSPSKKTPSKSSEFKKLESDISSPFIKEPFSEEVKDIKENCPSETNNKLDEEETLVEKKLEFDDLENEQLNDKAVDLDRISNNDRDNNPDKMNEIKSNGINRKTSASNIASDSFKEISYKKSNSNEQENILEKISNKETKPFQKKSKQLSEEKQDETLIIEDTSYESESQRMMAYQPLYSGNSSMENLGPKENSIKKIYSVLDKDELKEDEKPNKSGNSFDQISKNLILDSKADKSEVESDKSNTSDEENSEEIDIELFGNPIYQMYHSEIKIQNENLNKVKPPVQKKSFVEMIKSSLKFEKIKNTFKRKANKESFEIKENKDEYQNLESITSSNNLHSSFIVKTLEERNKEKENNINLDQSEFVNQDTHGIMSMQTGQKVETKQNVAMDQLKNSEQERILNSKIKVLESSNLFMSSEIEKSSYSDQSNSDLFEDSNLSIESQNDYSIGKDCTGKLLPILDILVRLLIVILIIISYCRSRNDHILVFTYNEEMLILFTVCLILIGMQYCSVIFIACFKNLTMPFLITFIQLGFLCFTRVGYSSFLAAGFHKNRPILLNLLNFLFQLIFIPNFTFMVFSILLFIIWGLIYLILQILRKMGFRNFNNNIRMFQNGAEDNMEEQGQRFTKKYLSKLKGMFYYEKNKRDVEVKSAPDIDMELQIFEESLCEVDSFVQEANDRPGFPKKFGQLIASKIGPNTNQIEFYETGNVDQLLLKEAKPLNQSVLGLKIDQGVEENAVELKSNMSVRSTRIENTMTFEKLCAMRDSKPSKDQLESLFVSKLSKNQDFYKKKQIRSLKKKPLKDLIHKSPNVKLFPKSKLKFKIRQKMINKHSKKDYNSCRSLTSEELKLIKEKKVNNVELEKLDQLIANHICTVQKSEATSVKPTIQNDNQKKNHVNHGGENYGPFQGNMYDQHMCSICFTGFNDFSFVVDMPVCHHLFHYNCIRIWVDKNPVCPICRINFLEFFEKNENKDK